MFEHSLTEKLVEMELNNRVFMISNVLTTLYDLGLFSKSTNINIKMLTHLVERLMAKKKAKKTYRFPDHMLFEVDKSLYCLLQVAYELKLISSSAFHHATTSKTNLLVPIENI